MKLMKLISIVGTRPQFLKLAPLAKVFSECSETEHKIIHSGQHYDTEMSQQIFDVLSIPTPDYCITKMGNSYSEVLGHMMKEIENILVEEKPEYVIVYGDCDTTLAGALVAKNLGIKLIHIESGMRSYNMSMPEERNRVMTDHISDLLLCSTHDSLENLRGEKVAGKSYYVGNLQLDLLQQCISNYGDRSILSQNSLVEGKFVLLTIHRHYNTTAERLTEIFKELGEIGDDDVIFPIHPRTLGIVEKCGITVPKNIKLVKPVNYLDMTVLERHCKYIITDSGGVQPEAWFLRKKCIVLRSETEWKDYLQGGGNILFSCENGLGEFITHFLATEISEPIYKDNAAKNILNIILEFCK